MDELKPAMGKAIPVPAPGFHVLSEEPYIRAFQAKMRLKGAFWWVQKMANLLFYGLVFSTVGWLGSQYIDHRSPATIKAELLTPYVKPASELRVKYTVNRHRLCEMSLDWFVFDGINEVRRFSDGRPYKPTGAAGTLPPYIKGFWMPDYLHPGNARLRVQRTYSCPDNYLHDFVVTEPDMPFVILDQDGKVPKSIANEDDK